MKPTDAAKLARRDLKAAFPGVKFSLRCRDWSTFHVTWTDGPTESEVRDLLARYNGWDNGGADGHVRAIPNRPDYAVARYILTHRTASTERARAIAAGVEAENPGVRFANPDDPFNDTQLGPEVLNFEGAGYRRETNYGDLGVVTRRIFNYTTA